MILTLRWRGREKRKLRKKRHLTLENGRNKWMWVRNQVDPKPWPPPPSDGLPWSTTSSWPTSLAPARREGCSRKIFSHLWQPRMFQRWLLQHLFLQLWPPLPAPLLHLHHHHLHQLSNLLQPS